MNRLVPTDRPDRLTKISTIWPIRENRQIDWYDIESDSHLVLSGLL